MKRAQLHHNLLADQPFLCRSPKVSDIGHCHDKVSRGLVSKQTVWAAYRQVQGSEPIRRPFDTFDLNSRELRIILGSSIFHNPRTLIELDGQAALAIEPPEHGASFPTLTGIFSDKGGNEILKIERNVWSSPVSTWDIQTE